MDFARSGMLGVVVICIALAGALFGAYLAGIDTEEYEYTAYEYLADMSGEFDYDQEPQYIEFDSNTNYVGYYSTNTGEAFPINKVDFVEYLGGVNNYAIKLPDVLVEQGTDVDLDVFESQGRVLLKTTQNYNSYEIKYHNCIRPAIQYASDFITDNLPDVTNTNMVYVKSPEALYEPEQNVINIRANWIFIVRDSDFTGAGSPGDYYCCTPEYKAENPTTTLEIPCLSCKINMLTRTVDRYYDNNCEQYCDTIEMASCRIVYGGYDGNIYPFTSKLLTMSSTFDYDVYDIEEYVYMDPTRGVALKEATQ